MIALIKYICFSVLILIKYICFYVLNNDNIRMLFCIRSQYMSKYIQYCTLNYDIINKVYTIVYIELMILFNIVH